MLNMCFKLSRPYNYFRLLPISTTLAGLLFKAFNFDTVPPYHFVTVGYHYLYLYVILLLNHLLVIHQKIPGCLLL